MVRPADPLAYPTGVPASVPTPLAALPADGSHRGRRPRCRMSGVGLDHSRLLQYGQKRVGTSSTITP